MTQTIEIIKEIKKIALQNEARPSEKKTVYLPKMKTGEYYRQGDLYIIKVEDNHPVGKKVERRQLADGESIGQRHVLLGDFVIYEGKAAPKIKFKLPREISLEQATEICLGYAFDVTGECRNNHPEHDDFVFHTEGKGRYQVWHQTNRKTLERVRD